MPVLIFKCQENHNYKELEIFLFIQDGSPNKSTVVDNIDSMLAETIINEPLTPVCIDEGGIRPKRGRPKGSFKHNIQEKIIIKNKVGRPKGSIKEKNVNIHTININTV